MVTVPAFMGFHRSLTPFMGTLGIKSISFSECWWINSGKLVGDSNNLDFDFARIFWTEHLQKKMVRTKVVAKLEKANFWSKFFRTLLHMKFKRNFKKQFGGDFCDLRNLLSFKKTMRAKRMKLGFQKLGLFTFLNRLRLPFILIPFLGSYYSR